MKASEIGEEEDPSLFVCEGGGKDNVKVVLHRST
ncbi:hypothetical protein EMWEY_00013860, partial [Eimeria maxima]